MADIPQPPVPSKALLAESEPLKAYHGLMGPFLDQLQDAMTSLTLAENFQAMVTAPATVTAGTDGALTGVVVPAGFTPLLVFFRAEELDAARRTTGVVIGGSAQWNTTPRTNEQGFQVTKAPGLTSGTAYSVTFVALLG
jgi:hypothetical protein